MPSRTGANQCYRGPHVDPRSSSRDPHRDGGACEKTVVTAKIGRPPPNRSHRRLVGRSQPLTQFLEFHI